MVYEDSQCWANIDASVVVSNGFMSWYCTICEGKTTWLTVDGEIRKKPRCESPSEGFLFDSQCYHFWVTETRETCLEWKWQCRGAIFVEHSQAITTSKNTFRQVNKTHHVSATEVPFSSGCPRYLELPRRDQRRLICQGVRCALLAGEALKAAARESDTLAPLGHVFA